MKTNTLIGMVIVIVVVILGWLYFAGRAGSPSADTATTTASTTIIDTTGQTSDEPGTAVGSAPTVITSTTVQPTNSTAVVAGTVNPNGSQTVYWYEYGSTANLGSKISVQSIGSGWSAIPSPGFITGLNKDTTYYYRLDAENKYGEMRGATQSFSTNDNPPGQGSVPTVSTASAKNVSRTAATVGASVNAHSSPTTYWFEYGTDATFGQLSAFQSAPNTNSAATVSASLTGLSPLTKYYFRIDAQNQYGTVNGSISSFTTMGPSASAAPVVTTQVPSTVGSTNATLRGTVNPNGTQTTYWFEYSTDSLLGSVLLKSTSQKSIGNAQATASVESDVSSLSAHTNYYYRIVAQNSAGTVRGDKQTFTTK